MRPPLLIFCGIPGSGKTTVARLVASSLKKSVHVQTDSIRRMLPRPSYSMAESRMVYSAAVSVAREALIAGYTVILDGTFLREEYRREARRALMPYCSSCTVVHVACDVRTAYMRNASRDAVVPFDRFVRLCSRFQEPRDAVRVSTSQLGSREAADAVLRSL